jgi:hypothetical protein
MLESIEKLTEYVEQGGRCSDLSKQSTYTHRRPGAIIHLHVPY